MTRMTKTQLVDENIRLRAQLDHMEACASHLHLEHEALKAQNEDLVARLTAGTKRAPAQHGRYATWGEARAAAAQVTKETGRFATLKRDGDNFIVLQ